jgi:uncharacterized membrane protein (UPF0182 family)
MDSYIAELLDLAATKHGLSLTGGVDIELVVQSFRKRSGEYIFRYYFVDHPNRLLFWVHEQPTEKLFDGVLGVEKMSHTSAPSCSSRQQLCLDSLFSQGMLLNISIGKSVIVYVYFIYLQILLTIVMTRICVVS